MHPLQHYRRKLLPFWVDVKKRSAVSGGHIFKCGRCVEMRVLICPPFYHPRWHVCTCTHTCVYTCVRGGARCRFPSLSCTRDQAPASRAIGVVLRLVCRRFASTAPAPAARAMLIEAMMAATDTLTPRHTRTRSLSLSHTHTRVHASAHAGVCADACVRAHSVCVYTCVRARRAGANTHTHMLTCAASHGGGDGHAGAMP